MTIEASKALSSEDMNNALGRVITGFTLTRLSDSPSILITGSALRAKQSGLSGFIELIRFRLAGDGTLFSGKRYQSAQVCGNSFDIVFSPYRDLEPEPTFQGYQFSSLLVIVMEVDGVNNEALQAIKVMCKGTDSHIVCVGRGKVSYYGTKIPDFINRAFAGDVDCVTVTDK